MASAKIRWTKVNDSGLIPRPRHGHRAVAVRELMIVFGGGNEGIVDELHAYNTVSNQWFCPVVKGDIPRGVAAFGLAVDNTRLLFHAGMLEYGEYSDSLYELQVSPYFATGNISSKWEWKKLRPKPPRFAQSPAPRLGHSFTFIGGKFYMFGGLCKATNLSDDYLKDGLDVKYSNELYFLEFRGHSCFWEMPQTYGTPPTPRESHSAVGHIDSLGNPKLILYGGMAGVRLGDVVILDLSSMTWDRPVVEGPEPLPRSLHSSSVVGDKMYVFGGWVPIDDQPAVYDEKWMCTNSLARLNLNTYKWEEIEMECPEGIPQARAGHSAVVVGSRIYIWSGRDGYRRAWDVQVCFKDLWFLEVGKPGSAGKVHLVKAGTKMLELTLPEVAFCDHYILQIMPYSVPAPTPKPASLEVKKKQTVPETDWADDDVGPMLAPSSPLPTVPLPLPKPEIPLPPISICDEPLPAFLLTPPKPSPPPVYTAPPPKPLPRLPPQIVQATQPFVNHTRPLIHHVPPNSQHQPVIQHHIPKSTPSNPFHSDTVQYVPVHEITQHFPASEPSTAVRMKAPGVIVSKPFKNSASPPKVMYQSAIDMSQLTPVPVKGIPQRATVVKVVNPSLGQFPNVKVQPPLPPQPPGKLVTREVFPVQQVPHPKHTIIINKPMTKLPGQQIVVVSSAPMHHPPQAIQTIARPEVNYIPPAKRLKVSMPNGMKTIPIQSRLPPPAPSRQQLQSPIPMYKNVKLQVNGKTLTVMMPLSTAAPATPVTNSPNKFVCYQQKPPHTVCTNSLQPKFTVRQDTNPNQPKQYVVQPDLKCPNSSTVQCVDVVDESEMKDCPMKLDSSVQKRQFVPQTLKIIGSRPSMEVPSKIIGQPVASCPSSIAVRSAESSEPPSKRDQSKISELPDPPNNIKISKTSDGAIISWSPPSKGPPATGYSVNLGVKADGENQNKVTFMTVYSDVHTKTRIPQDVLDRATLSFPKPTIIFRVSARNENGCGPATQVRWLQDTKNDSPCGLSTDSA